MTITQSYINHEFDKLCRTTNFCNNNEMIATINYKIATNTQKIIITTIALTVTKNKEKHDTMKETNHTHKLDNTY